MEKIKKNSQKTGSGKKRGDRINGIGGRRRTPGQMRSSSKKIIDVVNTRLTHEGTVFEIALVIKRQTRSLRKIYNPRDRVIKSFGEVILQNKQYKFKLLEKELKEHLGRNTELTYKARQLISEYLALENNEKQKNEEFVDSTLKIFLSENVNPEAAEEISNAALKVFAALGFREEQR